MTYRSPYTTDKSTFILIKQEYKKIQSPIHFISFLSADGTSVISLYTLEPEQKYFSFLSYIWWIMLLQLSQFPPLRAPPLSSLHSLRQSSHHCSYPWVMHISSLASPFPLLYFTSPSLFCNCLFVLLNPLTSSPTPLHPSPIWQPSKHSLYPWFYLYYSCLFSLFFQFSCWQVCIYTHFIVHSFDLIFLNKYL